MRANEISDRAHGAGLERHVEVVAREAFGAQAPARLADREHLGVRGGVGELARAVAGGGDDKTVGGDDDGADRHLAAAARGCRLGERAIHVAEPRKRCHKGARETKSPLPAYGERVRVRGSRRR